MIDRAELQAAAEALEEGNVVGVPTETVYGLAVDPLQRAAVSALFDLKGRPVDKPFALIATSVAQAERYAHFNDAAAELAVRYWPGALTVVVSRTADAPEWLGERRRRTVGVRVPDHPVALALLEVAGPLIATSANWSDDPPVLDHAAAAAIFGDSVAIYLEGEAGGGESSTVVDVTTEDARLIRKGPIDWPPDS